MFLTLRFTVTIAPKLRTLLFSMEASCKKFDCRINNHWILNLFLDLDTLEHALSDAVNFDL